MLRNQYRTDDISGEPLPTPKARRTDSIVSASTATAPVARCLDAGVTLQPASPVARRTDSASATGTPRSTQDARAEMIRAMKAQSMPASTNAERADAAAATPSQEAKSARARMIESLKARY